MRSFTSAGLAALVLVALTGCGSSSTESDHPSAAVAASSAASSASVSASGGASGGAAADAFLATHGLGGLSVTQIVEKLDASADDKQAGPMGSVRPTELQLTDAKSGEKVSLPMPADAFYLAMAPYTSETHECFNHSTAACQGELVGEKIHVTLSADGKTVVDKDLTTGQNGFAAVWVPRGLTGTLKVTRGGQSVQTPVSTKDDAPTCLTTPLKLG